MHDMEAIYEYLSAIPCNNVASIHGVFSLSSVTTPLRQQVDDRRIDVIDAIAQVSKL
jgi:hypothetical protein